MAIEERNKVTSNILQNIILENREKLTLSGVLDVLSFDDQVVILETELGMLTVKGQNLKITKLSLDTADVIIEGEVINLAYSEKTLDKKDSFTKIEGLALFYKDEILPKMASLRDVVDGLEVIVDEKVWPYPSYGKLLFGVR